MSDSIHRPPKEKQVLRRTIAAFGLILSWTAIGAQDFTGQEAYGFAGCSLWLDVESEFEDKYATLAQSSVLETNSLGCKFGVGFVAANKFGIEGSYGPAPEGKTEFRSVNPMGEPVDFVNTVMSKFWNVTATYERRFTDQIVGVAKAGITHTRIAEELIPRGGAAAGLPAVRQETSSNDPTISLGLKFRVKEPDGPVSPGFDILAMFTTKLGADTFANALEVNGRLTFPVKQRPARRR